MLGSKRQVVLWSEACWARSYQLRGAERQKQMRGSETEVL